MTRERALKLVLVLVGLLFTAGIYPLTMTLWQREQAAYPEAMLLSLYVTLGILLLLAARNPAAHRSLIAFAAWSSFAHAAVMVVMAFQAGGRDYLLAAAFFVVIGVPLFALAPANPSGERASTAGG